MVEHAHRSGLLPMAPALEADLAVAHLFYAFLHLLQGQPA